jgi:hypothetical protein
VVVCDLPVPVHSDCELRLLDLMRSGWLRSPCTPSVSDLISASGSRSDGRGEMGGGSPWWLGFRRGASQGVDAGEVLEVSGGYGDVDDARRRTAN